jgi:type I restriction enzyme S subunit
MLKPAGSILEAHERIARPLFERILHNRSLIDNLSELRDTLLPRLISGKLRVPEAEKLVEAVL